MKRSKLSDPEIASLLNQVEKGATVDEVCRREAVSVATFYAWRKRFSGLMPSEMGRVKQLEEENSKLKKAVAELVLERAMLQDVVSRKS